MAEIVPSLKILMEEGPRDHFPGEPVSEIAPITPYGYKENLIASQGLWRYMYKVSRDVKKKSSDPEDVLTAVYDLFTEDIDRYRLRAHRFINNLSRPDQPRAFYAQTIGYTLLGFESRLSGKWPSGKARERRLNNLYRDVMGFSEFEATSRKDWALRNALHTRHHWARELNKVRSHPLTLNLLEAIEVSDHDEYARFTETV